MRVRISIALDGQIGIFVEEGTYEEAQALSRQLYAAIGLVAPIQAINPPEQHRHDPQHAHLHTHQGVH